MRRKLCIVAAIGPGLGLSVAKRFAREGFDLALLARAASLSFVEELRRAGADTRVYEVDLADSAAIASTMAKVRAAQGAADVLVYNGGAWNEGPPLQMSAEAFTRDLALCVTGAYACTQAVYPDMKAKGAGVVLFTGGGLALNPAYGAGVLSLTAGKAGLRGFGLALHEALKPDGIHVAMVTVAGKIAPGGAFDPDKIANEYWALFAQSPGAWDAETIFSGRA